MTNSLTKRFHSQDPGDAAWRLEAARVDAAIEGILQSPRLDAFVAELDAKGVPIEEQIELLIAKAKAAQDEKNALA